MKSPNFDKEHVASFNRQVGERVRLTRIRQGIKQNELARRVGVNSPQMHKYESGEHRMTAGMLLAIAKAMNVETSELFPRREICSAN